MLGVYLLLGGCGSSPSPSVDLPVLPPQSVPMALHRLNRLEYNNTVRDLLNTQLRPADAFPPDAATEGFDTVAEGLELTPALFDQYYLAARDVVQDALDTVPAVTQRFEGPELGVSEGYPVGDAWSLLDSAVTVVTDVPAGEYRLSLVAGGSQVGDAPSPRLALELDGTWVAEFDVQGSAAERVAHEHMLELTTGEHEIRYVPINYINDARVNDSNTITVRQLDLISAEEHEGPGRAKVFVCQPSDDVSDPCAHEVIWHFAERAWRRPLTVNETASLSALYDVLRDGEEPTEDAIRLVLRSILISPKFLYRAHHVVPDQEDWLDYELASRLSYFLWSSMPSDALFAAAAQGSLRTSEGLRDTVSWMLTDARAQGFLDGFAEQWLATRHLSAASLDPSAFPTFNPDVRDAMEEEAKRFVGDFLVGDTPVVHMLNPTFAYRNDVLSDHYGLERPGSSEMQRMAVGPP